MNTESSPHFLSSSPSFTDSGIDLETTTSTATTVELSDSRYSDDDDDSIIKPTPSTSHATTASSLNERISYIAHLAAENHPLRKFSVDEHAAIEKCLGDLETLLLDPRPGISRVIALNRPSSSSPPLSRTETPTPATTSTSTRKNLALRRKEKEEPEDEEEGEENISLRRKNQIAAQTSAELKSVLGALTSVNEELQQRYLESRHIHDLFIIKCEGLAQRIIELENEVHELKSDILEDTIELEGLRGTIRGLESWVNRWQRQRKTSSSSSTTISARRPKKNSWRWKKQSTKHDADDKEGEDEGNDFETFLDGVLAWMRGWNDVEEGFLIRARRRKMRRDLKSSTAR